MSTQQLKCREGKALWTLAFHHWVVGSVLGLDWHEVELLFSFHYLYGAPGNLEKKNQELRAGVDPMNFLLLLGTLNKWELAIKQVIW